jgi:monovalent cation:proton antiporter-2 (CPA2) family protein
MNSFTQQALIFIAAAVVLVPLFQKLGFGSILGYLLSGVLVGPFGFKLIEDAESIMHFSELGVVLLLFIIGLEIQPRKLWSMRRHLFGFGALQILFCTIIFSVCGFLFNLSLLSSIVIGFAMSLSSTAFAVQTLTEKNLFNTEFGRASFSILLMQDLVAIPALAIIPVLALADSPVKTVGQSVNTLAALAAILVLVVISRFLIRPLFRIIASTRSREVFTAVTLLIVLGVAALMQKVGLSAALGTFIAGVLLADSEYRHELETNIEPFKGLLMGLFFIAVGMSVSLDLILANPVQILLLSLGYLALKTIVIYGIGRLFKMNHHNSKMMSLAIAQGGEFAFVIFGLVAQISLVPTTELSFLTAIITVSMALNPMISLLNEVYVNAKRKVPQYDEIKNESPDVIIAGFGRFGQTFGRILRSQGILFVAIDHDPNQIELVRRFGNKVYYGDATRKDLLEAAGIKMAKYFILAIDDIELSLKAVEVIKENYPHIKIFARARNRGHVFELIELGITRIKRETFDSSVNFAKDLLVEMGYEDKKALKIIERFKTHDEIMVQEQYKVRTDDKSLISVS